MRKTLTRSYQIVSALLLISSPVWISSLHRYTQREEAAMVEVDPMFVIKSTVVLFLLILSLSFYVLGLFKVYRIYAAQKKNVPIWVRGFVLLVSIGLCIPLQYISLVGVAGIVFMMLVARYSRRPENQDPEPETKVDFGV